MMIDHRCCHSILEGAFSVCCICIDAERSLRARFHSIEVAKEGPLEVTSGSFEGPQLVELQGGEVSSNGCAGDVQVQQPLGIFKTLDVTRDLGLGEVHFLETPGALKRLDVTCRGTPTDTGLQNSPPRSSYACLV